MSEWSELLSEQNERTNKRAFEQESKGGRPIVLMESTTDMDGWALLHQNNEKKQQRQGRFF